MPVAAVESGVCVVTLTEAIIGGVTGLVGLGVGAYLSPFLKGTPPRPKSSWTEIDKRIDEKRKP